MGRQSPRVGRLALGIGSLGAAFGTMSPCCLAGGGSGPVFCAQILLALRALYEFHQVYRREFKQLDMRCRTQP